MFEYNLYVFKQNKDAYSLVRLLDALSGDNSTLIPPDIGYVRGVPYRRVGSQLEVEDSLVLEDKITDYLISSCCLGTFVDTEVGFQPDSTETQELYNLLGTFTPLLLDDALTREMLVRSSFDRYLNYIQSSDLAGIQSVILGEFSPVLQNFLSGREGALVFASFEMTFRVFAPRLSRAIVGAPES